MGFLAPLASLLGLEMDNLSARVKSAVVVAGLIGLFGLLALGFLLAAGYMALAEMIGPLYAALAFAGGFLVLALGVYLGAEIARRRRERKLAQRRRASETGALLTTAAATALPIIARSPGILRFGLPAVIVAAFLLLRDDRTQD
ncbi:hypothetical protein [uncultured Devosia sp.]|uniref:hypothetical protein n=1 Tax=uncultured Devosia sp. TaxID=211434 RepID=UPI002614E373|nr:hypothetical protein [uncultured Devosia sp.]